MRLLAVVPHVYDTSPGQRYRIEQWEPQLRERGVEITYAPFECPELKRIVYQPGNARLKVRLVLQALLRRRQLLRRVAEYDAVYVFREAALLGPPVFERWIHRAGVPIVFDFDDAVFLPYVSPANGYLSLLKFPGKTRSICRIATHVMAGNRYLAEYARQVNPNVTVVPSTIDTTRYRPANPPPSSDVPVIGWTGSFSTYQHLDTVRGVLRSLAEHESFRLRVIGPGEYRMDGVSVDGVRWRSESEVEDLLPAQIGIMPLPDEPWARGKCGMKALQFMALGIPVVCSPVGVNAELIRDGQNGYLAASFEEWTDKLGRLLHSPELRTQLGRAGRETVEDYYSASLQAPRVHRILEAASEARRGAPQRAHTGSPAHAQAGGYAHAPETPPPPPGF